MNVVDCAFNKERRVILSTFDKSEGMEDYGIKEKSDFNKEWLLMTIGKSEVMADHGVKEKPRLQLPTVDTVATKNESQQVCNGRMNCAQRQHCAKNKADINLKARQYHTPKKKNKNPT